MSDPTGLHPFWLEFSNREPACIMAPTEVDAVRDAKEMGLHVVASFPLPYPATPRLDSFTSHYWSFCYRPERCKGRLSCPNNPCCTE